MFFRIKIISIAICCILGTLSIPKPSDALTLNQYLNNNAGPTENSVLNISAQSGMRDNRLFSNPAPQSDRSDLRNTHKTLGYGTVLFAGMAAFSRGNNGMHKGAGIATAVMAVAACATGYAEYGDYFNTDDGLSARNVHIVLGTMAAVGFVATAVSAGSSGGSGHASIGMASTALAVVPVVVIKF